MISYKAELTTTYCVTEELETVEEVGNFRLNLCFRFFRSFCGYPLIFPTSVSLKLIDTEVQQVVSPQVSGFDSQYVLAAEATVPANVVSMELAVHVSVVRRYMMISTEYASCSDARSQRTWRIIQNITISKDVNFILILKAKLFSGKMSSNTT